MTGELSDRQYRHARRLFRAIFGRLPEAPERLASWIDAASDETLLGYYGVGPKTVRAWRAWSSQTMASAGPPWRIVYPRGSQ